MEIKECRKKQEYNSRNGNDAKNDVGRIQNTRLSINLEEKVAAS